MKQFHAHETDTRKNTIFKKNFKEGGTVLLYQKEIAMDT